MSNDECLMPKQARSTNVERSTKHEARTVQWYQLANDAWASFRASCFGFPSSFVLRAFSIRHSDFVIRDSLAGGLHAAHQLGILEPDPQDFVVVKRIGKDRAFGRLLAGELVFLALGLAVFEPFLPPLFEVQRDGFLFLANDPLVDFVS